MTLTLDELIQAIHACLSPDGRFSILLPAHRREYFAGLAKRNGFFLQEELLLRQTDKHSVFRSIGLFGLTETGGNSVNELIIKDNAGNNTIQMKNLMNEYYASFP